MAKNKNGQRAAAKPATPVAAPSRRRTLILTGRGKLVRGWILPSGEVAR